MKAKTDIRKTNFLKTDMLDKADIAVFIQQFYTKLISDPFIGHFFLGIDLSHHLPNIIHFWDFVLFGAEGYKTNVVQKHEHMKLTPQAFDVWLNHFNQTLDELFEGENCEIAKQRAWLIGETMKAKFLSK